MNNIDSKEYSYDVQCALIVGALFFGLSVLFLIASMHPYVFSIIFCIVFSLLLFIVLLKLLFTYLNLKDFYN